MPPLVRANFYFILSRAWPDLNEAGIFPDKDLVLTVAVGGDQLAGMLGPGQVAHLGNAYKQINSTSKSSEGRTQN